MYFGTVNRMIFAELVKVFLMSLLALTGMFLLAGLIQEASQKGLSPTQTLLAIPHIVPNTLPFTIPATTLFATCIVYSRMSADNEVLVLRAAGVNIYHLLWPALVLGLLATTATATLYYETIPDSQQKLREQLIKDGENLLYGMIKREGGLRQGHLDFALFVRDVQGRDLIDVVVKKRRPDKQGYELVARAQTARLRLRKVGEAEEGPGAAGGTDRPLTVTERFYRRQAETAGGDPHEVVVYMDRCFVDSLRGDAALDLHGKEFTSPLPPEIFGKPPKGKPSAQTWTELLEGRAEWRRDIAELRDLIREQAARGDPPTAAGGAAAAQQMQTYRDMLKEGQRRLYPIETEIWMRPALAVGCLCFVLIGCPVGVWASRSDYLSVFVVCFLPTVFVYYPLLLASVNLAKTGKAPPTVAWVANGLAFLVALVLIKRLMKR